MLSRLRLAFLLATMVPAGCKHAGPTTALNVAAPRASPLVTIETRNNEALIKKLQMIDSADRSIEVAYYIFAEDAVGRLFAERLSAAAGRGVHVRILMDGSPQFMNREFFRSLVASHPQNIELAYFRPFTLSASLQTLARQLKPLETFVRTLFAEGGVNQRNVLNALGAMPGYLSRVLVGTWGSAFTLRDFEPMAGIAQTDPSQALVRALAAAMEAQAGIALSDSDRADLVRFLGNRLKRLHHKLLLVDGRYLATGGRNVWGDSHLEFDQKELSDWPKFAPTLDSDVFVDDRATAQRALAGFEGYWQCITDTKCPAGIDVELEVPERESISYWRSNVQPRMLNVADLKKNNVWFSPINDFHIETNNATLTYVENAMHRQAGKTGYLNEKPNDIQTAFVQRIRGAKKNDRILIKAAYMILPPVIFDALIGALGRGVEVILITNSPFGSNHAIVPFFGRLQFLPLLVRAGEVGGDLKIYEYHHPMLVHDKVWIFNDEIFVGSANADPRSFYLNTENGVIIGPGQGHVSYGGKSFPSVAAAYTDWQLRQIEDLQTRSWANFKTGTKLPYLEQVLVSKLLSEEFEPYYYEIVDRPTHDVMMTLKEAFKGSIYKDARRSLYQQYLYSYLLLQL